MLARHCRLASSLAALLFVASSVCYAAKAPAGFDTAFAILRAEHEKVATTGATIEHMKAVNDAFFAAVEPGTLGIAEIAALMRLNPFAYGDRAHAIARELAERLREPAAARDAMGALAAVLRVELAGPAGFDAAQRQECRQALVAHPALPDLVSGEFGDLALFAAFQAAKTDAEKERVLALIDSLDAQHGTSAAGAVGSYWSFITRSVPEGARRQALRQKLADYLDATLARESSTARSERSRTAIERSLALLQGPDARGELLDAAAPEIHFDWVNRGDWRSLSALRGKVVVLEFWATWCGPCVEAFPKIAELVRHFDGLAVEVVGVTSVQGTVVGLRSGALVDCRGDPQKEIRLVAQYIQERGLTWPIAFSREPVFNPACGIDGIPHVVIIAPDGTVRHHAAGLRLDDAIRRIDALLEEFHLPHSTASLSPQ